MIKKNEKLKDKNKIKEEIFSLKKTIMNFNFQKSTGQLEKTSNLRKSKKDLARLKTQLRQLNETKGGNSA